MAVTLMYIPKDDTQNYPLYYNYWLKSLVTEPYEPTNLNLIKVPKGVKQKNRKSFLQKFGDYCSFMK